MKIYEWKTKTLMLFCLLFILMGAILFVFGITFTIDYILLGISFLFCVLALVTFILDLMIDKDYELNFRND